MDFAGRTLLITGGTGSFGRAVLERLLPTQINEIRIFSRDEKKQDDMRQFYGAFYPEFAQKLHFYLGDVRQEQSLRAAMRGVDYVFHAAALKQVPSCEAFPMEAVQTNILGAQNVLSAAIDAGVKTLVGLSTDKAVYPVNAMGMTKALMEKLLLSQTLRQGAGQTRICCTRYGNILCSRGSVVPRFVEQIQAGLPLTVTDPAMTRFLMSMDEAIDLVLLAFFQGQAGDILIRKAPACRVGDLAQAVRELFEAKNPIVVTGLRKGDKRHETLLTREEAARAVDLGEYYRIPLGGSLAVAEPVNSERAVRLSVEQIKQKLCKARYIQEKLAGLGKECL